MIFIGVCSLKDSVYCIGGWNGQYGIKQCDAYNPEQDKWETVAPLHIGNFINLFGNLGSCGV